MRRRPGRTRILLVVLIVVAVLSVLAGWLAWSPTDPPGRVDAILVLAGGQGERERTGVRLAREGIAPVLVFSDGGRPGSSSGRLCRQRFSGVRVLCLTPRPDTTRGEASAFAEMAAREGWRSVAVVTTGYHVRRARLLLDRCFPGTVHAVGASSGMNRLRIGLHALREGAALVAVLTLQRGC